jgi:hypothetical protein
MATEDIERKRRKIMGKSNDFITDIKHIDSSITKIDATNPDNLSNKVLDERETRKRLLTHAKMVGCLQDMMLLFQRYDNLLRNCTNEQERKDIGKLASVSVYRLLGGGGQLYIDGQLVCDDEIKR